MSFKDSEFCCRFREEHRYFCNEYAPILNRLDNVDHDNHCKRKFSKCCKTHNYYCCKKHEHGCCKKHEYNCGEKHDHDCCQKHDHGCCKKPKCKCLHYDFNEDFE
jgi:hypothetical protein